MTANATVPDRIADRPRCPRCRRWPSTRAAAQLYAAGTPCRNCQKILSLADRPFPCRCPSCGRDAKNASTRARYSNGFPCPDCAAARRRAEIASAPGCPRCGRRPHTRPRAELYKRGVPCAKCAWRLRSRLPRVDESFACDLAELAALTRENGYATRFHWRDVRGGSPAAADRHWERLKARLAARDVPHRTEVVEREGARLVALVVELDHEEVQRCATVPA